jgi:hypothetical protein
MVRLTCFTQVLPGYLPGPDAVAVFRANGRYRI